MELQRHPWLLRDTRRHWPLMSAYERLEHGLAFLLSLVIAILIVLALIQLLVRVVPLLLTGVRVALRRDGVVQADGVAPERHVPDGTE